MNQIAATGFDYDGLPRSFVRASQKRARQIIELDQHAAIDWLEQGRLLKEQREAFGSAKGASGKHGKDSWTAWVQSELGWRGGRDYAWRLITVYETFRGVDLKSTRLGLHQMKALATRSTPTEVRQEAIKRIESGEALTEKEINKMKKDAAGITAPTPTDAKTKAQVTGEPQIASDGKIYTPLTNEEADAYTERRDRTYAGLDAVNEIAAIDISPKEWLEQADKHWLNDLSLSNIERANDWLVNLIVAYKQSRKIIDGK